MDPVAPEGRTTLVILNYLSQSIPISDLAIWGMSVRVETVLFKTIIDLKSRENFIEVGRIDEGLRE